MNARADLPALDAIRALAPEMRATRHRIHASSGRGFEAFATSGLAVDRLSRWGDAVHRGLGGTGVVGTLVVGDGPKRLGIRAARDALPIQETATHTGASQMLGKVHAGGQTATPPCCGPQRARCPPVATSTARCMGCFNRRNSAWAVRAT